MYSTDDQMADHAVTYEEIHDSIDEHGNFIYHEVHSPLKIIEHEKKFERQTGIVVLHLNRTYDSYFGGLFNQPLHYFIINSTSIDLKLKAQEKSQDSEESMLYVTITQEENDDHFIEMYMSEEPIPTEKKHSFACNTKQRDSVKVRLPPLSHNLTWYIMLKASPHIGIMSNLKYTVFLSEYIHENKGLGIITIAIGVVILMALLALVTMYIVYKNKGKEEVIERNTNFLIQSLRRHTFE